MARLARVVIPGVPHHVTQRGNRRQPVFFSDDDRRAYLALIAEAAKSSGARCLAWCLMDNHIHLTLVLANADGVLLSPSPLVAECRTCTSTQAKTEIHAFMQDADDFDLFAVDAVEHGVAPAAHFSQAGTFGAELGKA